MLERLPIFKPMSNTERDVLAPKMKCRNYKAGDIVVEQGVVASSLVILISGVLAAMK
jgi:signal-transduction protein with cAMP-binding, CBS, and nucleotidyltransferase domain